MNIFGYTSLLKGDKIAIGDYWTGVLEIYPNPGHEKYGYIKYINAKWEIDYVHYKDCEFIRHAV